MFLHLSFIMFSFAPFSFSCCCYLCFGWIYTPGVGGSRLPVNTPNLGGQGGAADSGPLPSSPSLLSPTQPGMDINWAVFLFNCYLSILIVSVFLLVVTEELSLPLSLFVFGGQGAGVDSNHAPCPSSSLLSLY